MHKNRLVKIIVNSFGCLTFLPSFVCIPYATPIVDAVSANRRARPALEPPLGFGAFGDGAFGPLGGADEALVCDDGGGDVAKDRVPSNLVRAIADRNISPQRLFYFSLLALPLRDSSVYTFSISNKTMCHEHERSSTQIGLSCGSRRHRQQLCNPKLVRVA